MKLNHVNLTVSDVPATVAFLETYFGLRRQVDAGEDGKFALMLDDDGLALTLMKGGENAVRYPRTFHIGFAQASEARVDEINARLKADGYDVSAPVRAHAWTFYVTAPGGFVVEVLA